MPVEIAAPNSQTQTPPVLKKETPKKKKGEQPPAQTEAVQKPERPTTPGICINWRQVFAEAALREAQGKKEIISIAPFYNDTEQAGDAWLSQGIPSLLIRFLQTDPKLGLLPESQAALLAPEHQPQYRIGGLFQHNKAWLRAFIQLSDAKGKLLAQFLMQTPYPGHTDFFTDLREAAEGILKKLGRKKIATAMMKIIENETDNVHSYENYIKGQEALQSYDSNKIETALLWFQESR
ncbi:MAG: hypothetical protein Q7T03_02580, partial [Deltaproteobacteria bacterium]|nr:hypothetical protein [Deltaproteobacteria bacterium]